MIDIPYADLRSKFDEYFEAHKQEIISVHGIHGKKDKNGKIKKDALTYEKNLGLVNLYSDILSGIAATHIDDLFHMDGMNLVDFSPDKELAHLVVLFFCWPVLEMTSEVNYHCVNPVKQEEEAAWQDRLKELQNKFRELRDYTDPGLPEKDAELLMDIIASKDGAPYQPYTFRRRWLALEQLPTPFRNALDGHSVGDLYEAEYEVPDLQNGGTCKITAHVKIYEAKTIHYPEVNDALAVKIGFESLEMLKNQFTTEFDNYVISARKSTALDHLINQVYRCAKLPQLPESCVFGNAQARMAEHISEFSGDKVRAAAAIGAKTEDEMVKKFRSHVVRDILQQLAMRKLAEIHGLDRTSPEFIDNLAELVTFVEPIPTETTNG